MIKRVDLTATDPLQLFVGPIEACILRAIWAGNNRHKDIVAFVYANMELTKSSISTVLKRMLIKNLVKQAANGRYYIEAPSERSFIAQAVTYTCTILDNAIDAYTAQGV